MSHYLAILLLGLGFGVSVALTDGLDAAGEPAPDDAPPVGPLGDLLRRDDWKSVRLRVGTMEGGKLTYKEARLTSKRDLDRLRSILKKARYIATPASYEVNRNQAFEVELGSGPAPRVTLYSPPKYLAIGEDGSGTYYEISSKDLIELCRGATP
jgi:hypothetical protein